MTFVKEQILSTIHQFSILNSTELNKLKIWIDANIQPQVFKLNIKEIHRQFQQLQALITPGIERRYAAHRNILQIGAWVVSAILYSLLTLAIYSLSPLRAIETEPPLNILDVGVIGTALQISGGLESPIGYIWLLPYYIHGFVVGWDIYQTPSNRWAKHSPYFLALLATLFWATFQNDITIEYWLRYGLAVVSVFISVMIIFFLLKREETNPIA